MFGPAKWNIWSTHYFRISEKRARKREEDGMSGTSITLRRAERGSKKGTKVMICVCLEAFPPQSIERFASPRNRVSPSRSVVSKARDLPPKHPRTQSSRPISHVARVDSDLIQRVAQFLLLPLRDGDLDPAVLDSLLQFGIRGIFEGAHQVQYVAARLDGDFGRLR